MSIADDKAKLEKLRQYAKDPMLKEYWDDFKKGIAKLEKEIKDLEKRVVDLDNTIELRLEKSGKSIIIALSDFDKAYTWNNAIKQVALIGNGWRIPTQEELKEIYEVLHLNQKGDFRIVKYWCLLNGREPAYVSFYNGSTENEANHNSYLLYDGGDFSRFTYFKDFEFSIRVVKDIERNT